VRGNTCTSVQIGSPSAHENEGFDFDMPDVSFPDAAKAGKVYIQNSTCFHPLHSTYVGIDSS